MQRAMQSFGWHKHDDRLNWAALHRLKTDTLKKAQGQWSKCAAVLMQMWTALEEGARNMEHKASDEVYAWHEKTNQDPTTRPQCNTTPTLGGGFTHIDVAPVYDFTDGKVRSHSSSHNCSAAAAPISHRHLAVRARWSSASSPLCSHATHAGQGEAAHLLQQNGEAARASATADVHAVRFGAREMVRRRSVGRRAPAPQDGPVSRGTRFDSIAPAVVDLICACAARGKHQLLTRALALAVKTGQELVTAVTPCNAKRGVDEFNLATFFTIWEMFVLAKCSAEDHRRKPRASADGGGAPYGRLPARV